MKYIIAIIIFCFVIIIPGCRTAAITENNLSGDWETIRGDYEYISLSISDDGNLFSGYLNGRLINSGTWSLKNEKLLIRLDNGHSVTYEKIVLKNGILDLNSGQEQYIRPRSAEQKSKYFLRELAKAQEIKFSEPKATEFTWYNNGGDVLSIKGQMISAEIIIKKDFSEFSLFQKKIAEFLEDRDFYISDMNVSEIVTGYESPGFMKVLIRSRTEDNTDKARTAYIDVICGIIQ